MLEECNTAKKKKKKNPYHKNNSPFYTVSRSTIYFDNIEAEDEPANGPNEFSSSKLSTSV